MKNQTHSPLPWKASVNHVVAIDKTGNLANKNSVAVCYGNSVQDGDAWMNDQARADAHLITIAANNHEALKGEINSLLAELRKAGVYITPKTKQARALLAKIKEEERE